MNKFLETIMDFINDNTTLLIIICVFLIFVLIGYLIDNSIKTRRMEKNLILENYTDNNEEIVASPEETGNEIKEEPVIEEKEAEETVEEEPELPEENNDINVDIPEIPVAPVEEVVEEETNEVSVEDTPIDNKIDDILLKDFSENNKNIEALTNVEEPKNDVSIEDNITLNPINNVSSIEEPKEEIPVEPVKKEESVYKNDKKLSDIFKKKTDAPAPATNLETTADYSTELDRILQKLNEASSDITDDSTLEETTDFTNMF